MRDHGQRWVKYSWIPALAVMFALNAAAQTVGDSGDYSNESHLIDGVTETVSGDYYVGDEGTNNYLEIISGGKLNGAAQIIVGNFEASLHNEILVTGAGSEINNSSFFKVGDTGSYNRVTIDDGAVVTSGNALYVGLNGGSHNLVVVTNNAEWYHITGSVSQVGLNGGVSNRLVVTDGALFSFHRILRAGNDLGSDYNSVHVLNGATVTNTADATKVISIGSGGANHNEFLISGTNSAFYSADVRISPDGAGIGNRLAVEDGGLLALTRYLRVGEHADSVSNRLDVTGAGAQVLVPTRAVKVGHDGTYNVMTVSNGALVSANGFIVGHRAGSAHNALYAGGAQLVSSGNFSIGLDGDYNTGVISGGSTVTVDKVIYIGESSSHNEMLVTGGETTMYSGDGLRVGFGAGSDYNRMVLSGGATYTNRGGYRLHDHVGYKGGHHNELIVEGPDTVWDGNRIYIGWDDDAEYGMHNRMVITNQAQVLLGVQMMIYGVSNRLEIVDRGEMSLHAGTTAFRIGAADGSEYNTLEVSGTGSSLKIANSGGLVVGNDASHNRLEVTAAGKAEVDHNLFIGVDGGTGNRVTVSGLGSELDVGGTIYVSDGGGEGNILRIDNNANVISSVVEVRTNGVLELDNATLELQSLTDPLTVREGGILRGSGTIRPDWMNDADAVVIEGVVAPGFSIGTLNIDGALTFEETAEVIMEIGAGGSHDLINVSMDLTFGGTLTLKLIDGFEPQENDSFTLFDAGVYSGNFSDIDDDGALLGAGLFWDYSQLDTHGIVSVIPEAGTTGLLLAGLAGLLALRRRRM